MNRHRGSECKRKTKVIGRDFLSKLLYILEKDSKGEKTNTLRAWKPKKKLVKQYSQLGRC